MQNEKRSQKAEYASNHMANERTFLAWIRTSIGLMAFGFVVEKFSLFIRNIAPFLKGEHLTESTYASYQTQGFSSIFGILLVALGALICILAFIKYKKTEKQLDEDTYRPSRLLDAMLTLAILLIGIFMVSYLINSIK